MSLKDKILEILVKENDYVSGEYIASKLEVTRSAVWKTIKSVKKDVAIESSRNGYKITETFDILNKHVIEELINKDIKVNIIESTTSTMDEAERDFISNKRYNTTFIAREQIRGIGREGRVFVSPKDKGIYMTLVIEPKYDYEDTLKITNITALAINRAIRKVTGINTKVKWINDIYLNDTKIGGILTRSRTDLESKKLDVIFVGIGLNIYYDKQFSNILDNKVSALFESKNRQNFITSRLVSEIINQFYKMYENLNDLNYVDEYNKNLYKKNNLVDILYKGEVIKDISIIEVDENYCLLLKKDDIDYKIRDGEIKFI